MVVKNLAPNFSSDTTLFYRGKKENQNSKIQTLINNISTPIRLFFLLLRKSYDSIVVNTSLSKQSLIRDGLLVLISKLYRIKVVLIIHGFDEKALKDRFLIKKGYFKADCILVNAETFKKMLQDNGYKKPIYIQFNPVSNELIESLAHKKRVENYTSPITNILFIARIEENKGIYEAVKAFEIVNEKLPELTLTIVGAGKELGNIKEYIKEKEIKGVTIVSNFPTKDEKLNLLNKSDILLFPTKHKEGLPINVLEAMTAGMTVITRPVGGIVDLYNQQHFGYLIESKDPNDFANAIFNTATSPTTINTRVNNAVFAQEYFYPSKIAKDIESLINQI